MTSMNTETIAERICRTKTLAARHMLQDEAARFGAQGIVSEALEAKLLRAEAVARSNEQSRSMTYLASDPNAGQWLEDLVDACSIPQSSEEELCCCS
jgi:hypothetical protein